MKNYVRLFHLALRKRAKKLLNKGVLTVFTFLQLLLYLCREREPVHRRASAIVVHHLVALHSLNIIDWLD